MPRALIRYEDFTRKEVHDIFAPETLFRPSVGDWGLRGTIELPGRPGDFVFFVSFGRKQGAHTFEEGVTTDGVLTWQSQPHRGLGDPQIEKLIAHDADKNAIHLFLRTRISASVPYTYLGRLEYLRHDGERERPVYFQWQILEWELPEAVRTRMGLELHPASSLEEHVLRPMDSLVLTPPPARTRGIGKPVRTTTFQARHAADHAFQDARNRVLGRAGELLILRHERFRLLAAGRRDLAEQVRHVAVDEGDGAGYDIASVDPDGRPYYVEVKTTQGSIETDFFISRNEVEFSQCHGDSYVLYRVYDFDFTSKSGRYYKLSGPVGSGVLLTPILFRARR